MMEVSTLQNYCRAATQFAYSASPGLSRPRRPGVQRGGKHRGQKVMDPALLGVQYAGNP